MDEPTSSAALGEIRDLQSRGQFLAAYDHAMSGLAADPGSIGLQHAAISSLARSGATSFALQLFERWNLGAARDVEIAGLLPRLLKDVALMTRDAADAERASAAYLSLWHAERSGWFGVNAAAMALLAGNGERAHDIAAAIAADLADTGNYWSAATLAEAALLRGDAAAAHRWLLQAEDRAGPDLAQRAVTRRQMRWEAALLRADPHIVDALVIPDTIHFCGHMPGAPADEGPLREAVAQAIAPVGAAYGSLAAGADIVIAEALLAKGASLAVVLPFPDDEFIARSVRPAGENWVARFHACRARAECRVIETTPLDDMDFELASRRAMGLAHLNAKHIDGRAWQLAAWNMGEFPDRGAGTATDVAAWGRNGATRSVRSPWPGRTRPAARQVRAPDRIKAAVLLADLQKFGTLTDAERLSFHTRLAPRIGAVVDAAEPTYRNARGDAVQAVFPDAEAAAWCAISLRDLFGPETLAEAGVRKDMLPRVALDYGGLHPNFDAVQSARTYSGRVFTRGARIEPVTPPGMIYATEAFACEIALAGRGSIICDDAGVVATAEGCRDLPLFAVRPLAARAGG